jgi:chemotaxis protein methyltransferase CheR
MAAAALAIAPETGVLSARNFERVAQFVYEYSGIKIPSGKTTMLEGRLRRRLRATGIESFDDYCAYLFEEGGIQQETVYLIDAVTTNKTDFFREPRHFDYLREQVLPLLARSGRREIKAWSSACSTGAEPYTLAMVLEEALGAKRDLTYSIAATDLSTEVLENALRGVYPNDVLAAVPPALRAKYVMPSRDPGRPEGRIVPQLRSKVGFGRLNLVTDRFALDRDLDIVFCRNVLIYFDKPTQEKVVRQICNHIRPGGYLFLGHSESIAGIDLPLRSVANTVFTRT